jgi:hypothetical protein
VDGTATVTLCVGYCRIQWDKSGGFAYFSFPMVKEGSYALPVMRGICPLRASEAILVSRSI